MPQRKQIDLPFPDRGVDVSTEYELQPERTTPSGVNVRVADQLADSDRGGSRPGLSKYISDRVNNLALVQCLDLVVITDPIALGGGPEGDGGGAGGGGSAPGGGAQGGGTGQFGGWGGYGPVSYPSRPSGDSYWLQREMAGGTGATQSRYVQSNIGSSFTPVVIAFDLNVTAGHLIVVVVGDTESATVTSGVADSQGNLYTQVGTYVTGQEFSSPDFVMSMWRGITNLSGALAVTVTQSEASNPFVAIFEYRLTDILLPLDGTANFSLHTPPNGNLTTSSVPVSSTDALLMGAFYTPSSSTVQPTSGFTLRERSGGLMICDRVGVSSAAAVTATQTTHVGAASYAAIGASFRKQ